MKPPLPFTIYKRIIIFLLMFVILAFTIVHADEKNSNRDGMQNDPQVMNEFISKELVESKIITIEVKEKQQIMFYLAVPLLLLLLATGALGIAMGVYGKQVFVAHMVCAGLSVTLAIGHAVVGIVWFYPF